MDDLEQRQPTCRTIQGVAMNEPGGISLSGNGSLLYLTDTNNHVIKAVDLITYLSRELEPVICSTDSTDHAERKEKKIVDTISLSATSGFFRLELQLNIASGLHLNADAPNTWNINLPSGWKSGLESQGPIPCGSLLCFDIEYNFDTRSDANNQMRIQFVIKAYLCNDIDGTCFVRENTYTFGCQNDISSTNNSEFKYTIAVG